MRIGFIGLGKMGRPMAEALLRAGFTVCVHNRSRAVVDALVAQHAEPANGPAEVAQRSDVLFTCLPTPDDVDRVLLGAGGAIAGARPGQIFVDASTIPPDRACLIADELARHGVAFLDGPVSGGPPAAQTGTLSVLAGGEEADFVRVEPALRAFADKIFLLGRVGSGSLAKLCNQLLAAIHQAAACEVMALGAKGGLDPRQLYRALSASSGQSRGMDRAIPGFVLPRDFTARATISLILKDLECALDAAATLGAEQILGSTAREMYREALKQGHGEKDIAAVILPIEKRVGATVA